MDALDYQCTIEYYEEMMENNLEKFAGRTLTLEEMIQRDNFSAACLEAIDHLDMVYKANSAEKV